MSLRQVPCPHCGEPAATDGNNPWRPFCSRRCKLIDLGDWFDEENRIPGRDSSGAGAPWTPPDGDGRH